MVICFDPIRFVSQWNMSFFYHTIKLGMTQKSQYYPICVFQTAWFQEFYPRVSENLTRLWLHCWTSWWTIDWVCVRYQLWRARVVAKFGKTWSCFPGAKIGAKQGIRRMFRAESSYAVQKDKWYFEFQVDKFKCNMIQFSEKIIHGKGLLLCSIFRQKFCICDIQANRTPFCNYIRNHTIYSIISKRLATCQVFEIFWSD